MYISQISTSSVSGVVEAEPVYCTPLGLRFAIGVVVSTFSTK